MSENGVSQEKNLQEQESEERRRYAGRDIIKNPRYITSSDLKCNKESVQKPYGTDESRGYYRKGEGVSKKKSRKSAAIVCTIFATLITVGIITIFVIRGFNVQNDIADKSEPVVATESTTVVPTQPPYTPITKRFPELEDDGPAGYMDGGLYIKGATGFDMFRGDEKSALIYSNMISNAKKTLGDDINVYNMVVPNHTAFGLPERILGELQTNDQRDNITSIYSKYSEPVIPVDVYNSLGVKRNEYIFYHTDNRWTSFGAYQAYAEFAKVANFRPIELSKLKKNTISNYSGSYIKSTGNKDLKTNLDIIEYYNIPGQYSCSVITRSTDGTIAQDAVAANMYKTKLSDNEDALNVFICGDNPLFTVKNQNKSSGDKLLVVKDTFGNALVPFLASNYDEVHVIDFRYYSGNIKEYCSKKEIKNVLFVNGIMSANSATQVNRMIDLLA